jgi:DNA-binding NarL/FixJ family response regulator
MEASRILIVDDFDGWRRAIHSIFQTRPELQIVAEAVDGAEAVEKAGQLKPDMILLDIGLPKLNGIMAARLISEVSPRSKILFVSETNDPDLVQGALNTGASGFVRKCTAGRELIPAVLAALRGGRTNSYEACFRPHGEIGLGN